MGFESVKVPRMIGDTAIPEALDPYVKKYWLKGQFGFISLPPELYDWRRIQDSSTNIYKGAKVKFGEGGREACIYRKLADVEVDDPASPGTPHEYEALKKSYGIWDEQPACVMELVQGQPKGKDIFTVNFFSDETENVLSLLENLVTEAEA